MIFISIFASIGALVTAAVLALGLIAATAIIKDGINF